MFFNFFCRIFLFLGTLQLYVHSLEICDMQLPSPSQDIYACPSKECNKKNCEDRCFKRNHDQLSLNLNITDTDNGILEVVYKLNNQNITEFTMELYVNETASPEECKKGISINKPEFWKLHSRRTKQLKWCDSTDCSEQCKSSLTVTFDYVYTSCYYVSVARKYGTTSLITLASCSQMLKTKPSKKKLSEMTPKVAPSVHPGEGASYIAHIGGTPKVIWVTLSSEFSKDEESKCQKCLNSRSCCVYNRDFKYNNNNYSFICEDHNYSQAECSLSISNRPGLEAVNCLFHNVTPGNYCISILYSDDRCIFSPTIWGEGMCHWTTALNVKELEDPSTIIVNSRQESKFYFLIVTAFLLIMIIILVVFIFWKRQPPSRLAWSGKRDDLENEKLCILSVQKVVILSPYSCKEFMDCVAKLRDVLKSKNCQVFDYWDPELYASVASSPTFWLDSLMFEESIRIIVVASECSRLLEKNRNLRYKDPDCFHFLFTYGLDNLKTFINNSYEKIFVVSLLEEQNVSDTQNDNKTGTKYPGFRFLNPQTVYTLPIQLENLILALHSADGFQHSISMNTPEVANFVESVGLYSQFVANNPNYVEDLFITRNGHQRWKS